MVKALIRTFVAVELDPGFGGENPPGSGKVFRV